MASVEDPKFITYLLEHKRGHDCYFVVGNESLVTPVKIGVMKTMLMAHSPVLRNELEESDMAEKDVVKVSDINPDTFTNFLRYVYGHDITMQLTFDEADDMMYAADKYLIDDLMERVAQRLMSLLTYDNICSLMNNPACFRHLELDKAITRMLQYDTAKVLQHNLFAELAPNAFLKILEQESVSVKEIEIWRAAVKWATPKCVEREGGEDQSQSVRSAMSPLLQHVRLCTLTANEFCEDVIPAGILDPSEIHFVGRSIGLKRKEENLTSICNNVTLRTMPVENFDLNLYPPTVFGSLRKDSTILMTTKAFIIELQSFDFSLKCIDILDITQCTDLKRVSKKSNSIVFSPPTYFCLEANHSYIIRMSFDNDYKTYRGDGKFENEHFIITFDSCFRHIARIKYAIGTSID